MALKLFKEMFNGAYDGVTPAMMIPVGGISDGKNVRKISKLGGWKVRKGSILYNTTALETPSAVNSLHTYINPRSSDYHFIAQCNSKLLDMTADPPGVYASEVEISTSVGTTPGFSCGVRENWFYADGSGVLLMWGGGTPYCTGFVTWDNSETAWNDFTRAVTDGNSSNTGIILGAASDVYYVCSPCIAEGIVLTFSGTLNSEIQTLVLSSWVAGAWADRSATDGTLDAATSTKTHNQNGSITWARNASDTMRVINGIMGYWYKVSFTGALTGSIAVVSCKLNYDISGISNKWSGAYEWVTGAKFFDQSTGEYEECLGNLSNESTSQYIDISSATTSDFLYLKTPEPAAGFAFGVPVGYSNVDAAKIDQIDYWDGDSWVAITTGFTDETVDAANDTSFAQTGTFFFNSVAIAGLVKRRKIIGDELPGYWYRFSWAAALSANTRVYMAVYAPHPEALPTYDGCVEFKGRLFVWGDPEWPNRLRYSALDRPDCFSGSDSGYTDPFGDMKKVLCAIKFYNELIVFKEDSVWLLEGFSPANFGILKIADTVGLASPKTAHVIETGFPTMHADEPLSIALWQDVDGIYVLDGRKPRKVSMPVDHYFNTEYATAIAAASIRNRQSFTDPLNNEYHFLLPAGELVYNYILDEWYPPWDREIDLDCGLALKGTDNRDYVYGGSSGGFVLRLENDTTDKTTANADKAIDHSIKTRAVAVAQGQSSTLRFAFRRVQLEVKARTSGDITTTSFKDMATSGTALATPAAMSLINTGYNLALPYLDASIDNCMTIALNFQVNAVDVELEIYSMTYALEALGEIGVQ